MDYYGSEINKLIDQLETLPGIGRKSAQRLAFHVIHMPEENVKALSEALVSARKNVHYCEECCTLTDGKICPICASPKRDHRTIMVVETTRDLAAYERTGKYNGVYRVLHGAISPMLGIGPNDIRLKDDRHVHRETSEADRHQGDPHRERRARRRRSGVCGRSNAPPGPHRPDGTIGDHQ